MIFALVVLYNKKCEDSLTIKSLKKYDKKIKIIVFDNSEKDFNNEEYCSKKGYEYYTENKNLGLSKAYNYVLRRIKKKQGDYLIILDDDTFLNDTYLNEVLTKTKEENFDILLPIVKSNQKIISPSNIQFNCRVKQIKKIEDINENKITAINSGMIVKIGVYNKILYNENLFLDYVDHEFMRQVRCFNLKVTILNSEIIQDFSRDKVGNINSELFRFKIYIKDFKKYCKLCNNMFYYYVNVLKFAFVQSLKHKNIVFLRYLFKR